MKLLLQTILSIVFLVLPGLCVAEVPMVFVSILPQKFFVQQICGDRIEVKVMVEPGASPATYEPKPSQMAALAGARAYFSVGVPFEAVWLTKISAINPSMTVVNTDSGIQKIPMERHHHHDEEHGHEEHEEHTEAGILDPHIWLAPNLVKKQVQTMLQSLREMFPEYREEFTHNSKKLLSKVDGLDEGLRKMFAPHQGMEFMVFHPSWGYFARSYGLVQKPIEIEGKAPKPSQLKHLIEYARHNGIRAIFVQPQFSKKSAKVIAREIGGEVIYADPLAYDWLANLRRVASTIQAATL